MSERKFKWFCVVFGVVAIVFVVSVRFSRLPETVSATPARAGIISSPSSIFAKIAQQKTPAVVNISTKQTVKTQGHYAFPDERTKEFYERFFPQFNMPREQVRQSLGSGFVVEADGHILTNSHVVAHADEIVVTFGDGHTGQSKEYPAKLIAADPKTDIALIKIESDKKLPVLALADSDKLQVGEWVMAIGNPFGFSQSVTVGVVSAKSRNIGAGPYDDFIQTDASINPGNSGGPLLNTKGEVVGINSAIFTGGMGQQGNIGIGFAIPINDVKAIYKELKKGKVKRGWLGVVIQPVTKELKEAFGLSSASGALVGDVTNGSPAQRAGIRPSDVIVKFNGDNVASAEQLPRMVASIKPGTKIDVGIIRNGKHITINMELGELPEDKAAEPAEKRGGYLGMAVDDITPQLARRLNVAPGGGVVVTGVEPGGPSATAGLRSGDAILEVNRLEIGNVDDFNSAIADVKPGDSIPMRVFRGRQARYVVINIPEE